ncbi:hypothetical protein [Azohydromonas aeria]|uniref:hypothetical protein n=1 Tax=Azohydromonas aeria TaxID=2590212 RepID=UPI0012FAFD7F|nr:hypothetical protein [Azohydromonas aeria]
MSVRDPTRRDFVRRGAYVAPAILTLAAAPEFAKAGSGKPDNPGGGKPDKPGGGKPDKPDKPDKPGKGKG